jgi:hypothetical protein
MKNESSEHLINLKEFCEKLRAQKQALLSKIN